MGGTRRNCVEDGAPAFAEDADETNRTAFADERIAMKKNETAFPQPIAPSGYELNSDNAGLTKFEYAKIEFMKALLTASSLNTGDVDEGKLAAHAERFAKAAFK